jgi:hypothetical protein
MKHEMAAIGLLGLHYLRYCVLGAHSSLPSPGRLRQDRHIQQSHSCILYSRERFPLAVVHAQSTL